MAFSVNVPPPRIYYLPFNFQEYIMSTFADFLYRLTVCILYLDFSKAFGKLVNYLLLVAKFTPICMISVDYYYARSLLFSSINNTTDIYKSDRKIFSRVASIYCCSSKRTATPSIDRAYVKNW